MSSAKKKVNRKKKGKQEKTTESYQKQDQNKKKGNDSEGDNLQQESEEREGEESPKLDEFGAPPMKDIVSIPQLLLTLPRFFPDFKSPKASILELWQNSENKKVFIKFLITTLSMFTLPLLVFWLLQFTDLVVQNDENRTLWAGIGAAVTVQVVSVVYIFVAIREGDDRMDIQKKKIE